MSKVNEIDTEFCKKIPKIELHAHLNGSVSSATIKKLVELKRTKGLPVPDIENTVLNNDAKDWVVFKTFKIIHELVDDTSSVELVTRDVIQEFAEDGVIYLELRSTPRANNKTGMTKRSYIETVLDVIDSIHVQSIGILVRRGSCLNYGTCRFLLAIDRRQSIEEAYDTLKLAEEYKLKSKGVVVGVDLSGDARVGDARDFIPLFQSAKARGLSTAMHVAEIPNPDEVLAILQIPPDRIGHGTFLHPDDGGTQQLVDIVHQQKIPLEICLTSNIICETASSVEDHHLKYWYSKGHPFVLCTDDKGVFQTTLSNEHYIFACSFGLSKKELWNLSRQAIHHTFTTEDEKIHLGNIWKKNKSLQIS